jgi:hypothetical protein
MLALRVLVPRLGRLTRAGLRQLVDQFVHDRWGSLQGFGHGWALRVSALYLN